jgi:hypothetical protein
MLCAVAVTTLVEETAAARCIAPPPQVRADVTVLSCVSVTFGSSHIQINWPPEGLVPLYKAGASYSGVIVVAQVKTSTLASRETDPDDAAYLREKWTAGSLKELFVHDSMDRVCRTALYGTLAVTTDPGWMCCDMLPWEGRCLVPWTTQIVTVDKGIAR